MDCESVKQAVKKSTPNTGRLPSALAWFAFRDVGIKEPSMHFTPHPSKCFLTNTDKASRAPVMDPLGELDETATQLTYGTLQAALCFDQGSMV